MHRDGNTRLGKGEIIGHGIGGGGHGRIVGSQQQDGGRRGMGAHLGVVAESFHQLVVTARVAQEVHHRTLMREPLLHGDDRIEKNLEVGTRGQGSMGGCGGGEMASGREAHDTHVMRVDTPYLSRVAHHLHGVLGIAHGQAAVPLGHAVGQHAIGNALAVEVRGPVGAFVLHREVGVAASGTVDDGPSGGLFGIEHLHGCGTILRDGHRLCAFGLCLGGQREGQQRQA